MSGSLAAPFVFVGAGGLGRKIAAEIPPVAFIDSFITGGIDGIPILTAAEALEQYPDATFVVTIWGASSDHRIRRTEDAMRRAGVTRIASFTELLTASPNLRPHYAVDHPSVVIRSSDEIYAAGQLWHDAESRIEFLHQVEARRTGRFDLLPEPVDQVQYFGTDLYTFRPDECVIDGGAFDGDSLRSYLALATAQGGKLQHWTAFEPDPVNCRAFTARLHDVPDVADRVTVYQAALGATAGEAHITGSGTVAATLNDTGAGAPVTVAPLDALEPRVTLLKLDIEGMEPDALAGAWQTLQRERPVITVCLYHRAAHLWQIPNLIAAHLTDYRFHLRAHGAEGWELVLYAVPIERAPVVSPEPVVTP